MFIVVWVDYSYFLFSLKNAAWPINFFVFEYLLKQPAWWYQDNLYQTNLYLDHLIPSWSPYTSIFALSITVFSLSVYFGNFIVYLIFDAYPACHTKSTTFKPQNMTKFTLLTWEITVIWPFYESVKTSDGIILTWHSFGVPTTLCQVTSSLTGRRIR